MGISTIIYILAKAFLELFPVILAERYQIIQPLARGGFGQTFLASDRVALEY
ncbi:MAG: hypothetical protein WBB01_19985 [Phormidesmis sp.]